MVQPSLVLGEHSVAGVRPLGAASCLREGEGGGGWGWRLGWVGSAGEGSVGWGGGGDVDGSLGVGVESETCRHVSHAHTSACIHFYVHTYLETSVYTDVHTRMSVEMCIDFATHTYKQNMRDCGDTYIHTHM